MFIHLLLALSLPVLAQAPPDGPPPDAEIIEQVRQRHPARAEMLERLRVTDPAAYERAIELAGHRMGAVEPPELAEARKRMREVELRFHEKAEEFRAAEEAAQKKLRKEIEALAGEMFDMRQEMRREQLAHLRSRIEELEAEIDKREEMRGEIIEEFVGERLGERPSGL